MEAQFQEFINKKNMDQKVKEQEINRVVIKLTLHKRNNYKTNLKSY